MFQRFPEPTRRAVFYGQEEALRSGVSEVTADHLLLGLMRERSGPVAGFLLGRGVPLEELTEAVRDESAGPPIVNAKDAFLADSAKRAVDRAYEEARAEQSDTIDPEHLFLGIIGDDSTRTVAFLRGRDSDFSVATAREALRGRR
jgi:ATP-dependent Clp protease ATP-binding subunit ClpA